MQRKQKGFIAETALFVWLALGMVGIIADHEYKMGQAPAASVKQSVLKPNPGSNTVSLSQ